MARILVADDASFMRQIMRGLVEELGHQVVGEAANGLEAVEAYREYAPDVVTMDLTMPHMDGLAAIDQILAMDPRARILVCSAMGDRRIVRDALDKGARDFVVKPFQRTHVETAIERLLAPQSGV